MRRASSQERPDPRLLRIAAAKASTSRPSPEPCPARFTANQTPSPTRAARTGCSSTNSKALLSKSPLDFEYLRKDPKRIVNASEEYFRAISPVTHIGRVCPSQTGIHSVGVEAGSLVSLCFASANHDETVFSAPEEVRLDRKPNPHVAFGFGPHLCLGAAHARLIVRTLLKCLCEQVVSITTRAAEEKIERETRYNRQLAWNSLTVRLARR